MSLSALLGPDLLKKKGETVPTDTALAGAKAVALYFSAHWCGPCRSFTPRLAEWYTKSLKAKGLEVVFVSSDKDQGQFDDYFGEQPWLALPFDDRATKAALSKKYKVQGIPTLVILDDKGETITVDGREAVSEDPVGANFPWKPPTFWEALGTEFLSGVDGETVDVDEIKGEGKVIGLYFSAHWCPPCRGFTPALIDAYKNHLKAKKLEIIFVSSDKSAAEFSEYYGSMPWLAIPNGDKRKAALSSRFGVRGIPAFVLVDGATGETITTNARGNVGSDPEGKEFPWLPKPIVDIANENPEGINEEVALCVLLDLCDAAAQAAALAALEAVATKSKAAKEGTLFFYATTAGGAVPQIRGLTKLEAAGTAPQMLLLDIPDDGGFYVSPASEVTVETIAGFLAAHTAKALERKQLGQ